MKLCYLLLVLPSYTGVCVTSARLQDGAVQIKFPSELEFVFFFPLSASWFGKAVVGETCD